MLSVGLRALYFGGCSLHAEHWHAQDFLTSVGVVRGVLGLRVTSHWGGSPHSHCPCHQRLACARLGHLSASQCQKLSWPSTHGFIVAGVTFRLTPVRPRRAHFASISSGVQPRVAPLLTLLRFWWMADGRKPRHRFAILRASNGTGCAH
jgi:hypothetical protein